MWEEPGLLTAAISPQSTHGQVRALQTYIKRVYYPFLLRDPEVHVASGTLCALWVHTHALLANTPHPRNMLSAALAVPSLDALPAALHALHDVLQASGAGAPP